MTDFKIISQYQYEITIDKRIFSEVVIFKSINWFIDKYNFFPFQLDQHFFQLKIHAKEGSNNISAVKFINKFNSYLNDYKTREIILNQTKNIRDILMIKAFSSISDFREDMISNQTIQNSNE
jgi:His-Xaa-Ser system protein HxsD